MNQTYNKKFHCTYLLHYYPFDTQVIFHSEKKSCKPKLIFLLVCPDLRCRPAAAAVCPGQCGAGPGQYRAADRHRADPVLHPGMEPRLQCTWYYNYFKIETIRVSRVQN